MDDATGQEQAAQEPSEAPPAANLYTRNPIQVEARQFFAYNGQAIADWCKGDYSYIHTNFDKPRIFVAVPGQPNYANVGDWVVRQPDGMFIVLSDTDFQDLYTPVYPSPTGE